MRIAFFASGISPHIAPMCDELYKYSDGNFKFFATDKDIIPAMKIMGAENLHKEKPYFVNVNDSTENLIMSEEWAREADVAIVGCSNCYRFIDIRFETGNKLTFKLRERLFKSGKRLKDDEKEQRKINVLTKYKDKNLYFLAAGTYAPSDLITIGICDRKIIKWGYFPNVSNKSFNELSKSIDGTVRLIWFGRFVREKLSLNAIKATQMLIANGYDVCLSMIGYGDEENVLKKYVAENGLNEKISFLGPMNENEIRRELQTSHIFLMTSNYEEGWGVVVNEAMSEGCVPVVSYATGASQMMIEDSECGKLFHYDNLPDLVFQIELLINNRELIKTCSKNAYNSISDLWNAEVAVKRLMDLINSIITGDPVIKYHSGPCSKIIPFGNEEDLKNYITRRRKG